MWRGGSCESRWSDALTMMMAASTTNAMAIAGARRWDGMGWGGEERGTVVARVGKGESGLWSGRERREGWRMEGGWGSSTSRRARRA